MEVEFRGRKVCLVEGAVGTLAPFSVDSLGWNSWNRVYALAESDDQIAWMAGNADVFKPVRDDSIFPIFWIKQPWLREIVRAG